MKFKLKPNTKASNLVFFGVGWLNMLVCSFNNHIHIWSDNQMLPTQKLEICSKPRHNVLPTRKYDFKFFLLDTKITFYTKKEQHIYFRNIVNMSNKSMSPDMKFEMQMRTTTKIIKLVVKISLGQNIFGWVNLLLCHRQ